MAAHQKPGRRTPALPRAPWACVLTVVALFFLIQLPHAPGRFYPDSTEYLTQVYGMLGDGRQEGREKAIQAFCDALRHPSLLLAPVGSDQAERAEAADECVARLRAQNDLGPDTRYGPAITDGDPISSARYEAIFLSRPGVALLYAPGVVVAGPRMGMWLTALVWTGISSVLIFLLLRRLGVSVEVGLLGQVLFLVLPIRKWAMAPLAEGISLTLVTACLLGAAYVLTCDRRRGFMLLAVSFSMGAFVRYSQFMLFAAALAGTLLIGMLLAHRVGRSVSDIAVMTGASVAALTAIFLLSRVLGWPSGTDAMQNLLTDHFRCPNVADPVGAWMTTNIEFWPVWLAEHLHEPFLFVTWVAGAWGVLRSRNPAAFVVLATVPAGLANQVGQPDVTQGDRLYIAAWLVAVYGLPILVHTFIEPAAGERLPDARPLGAPPSDTSP
jgi:hypothetical protein